MFKQDIKYICKIHRNKKIIIYTVHYYRNVVLPHTPTHTPPHHHTTTQPQKQDGYSELFHKNSESVSSYSKRHEIFESCK